MKITGTETTMKKAIRKECKIRGKIELLNHGAGDFSANGISVRIWGYEGLYTCNKAIAKQNDLPMCR